MACVGQTPPQVWHSVQSVTRVVKSGLMASKGQISTHLLQWIQLDSTLFGTKGMEGEKQLVALLGDEAFKKSGFKLEKK